MDYKEFYERFGGSYRTVNLIQPPMGLRDQLVRAYNYLRSRPSFPVNRRFYTTSSKSGVPKEFIRLDPWEGEYLFMVACRTKRGIVEIGRFHGGSTFLLACANTKVRITSIDIEPQDDARLRTYLKAHGVGHNLTLIVGDSQKTDYPQIGDIDLLFIDGDHSYEGCMNDLENWYPKVVPGGHVLLHDSYFGCPVQEAIVDFTTRHDVRHVRWPYIIASHWHTSSGSIAHFMKRTSP